MLVADDILCDDPSDAVLGGFTVVGDKTKTSISAVSEHLPSWIVGATVFPGDVSLQKGIEECPEMNDFIRERLKSTGRCSLFPVQSSVIPFILRSYHFDAHRPLFRPVDVCISAPTGSGKTLAYCVPVVQLLLHRVNIFIRALVIVPVRDLACQVYNVFQELIEGTDLKVALLCGLKSLSKEQVDLIDLSNDVPVPKADIVIATPGRFVDHVRNTPGFSMDRLRFLIIDEADRVITEERQDWYRLLEDCLYHPGVYNFDVGSDFTHPRVSSCHRSPPRPTIMHQFDYAQEITLQKILVSATLTHDPEPLKRFNLYFPRLFTTDNVSVTHSSTNNGLGDSLSPQDDHSINTFPNECRTNQAISNIGTFSTPTGLKEYIVCVPIHRRALFLLHLVKHRKFTRILCFTNARITTERLYLLLKSISWLSVARLSAQLPTSKRQRILHAFNQGETNILVCTDNMARGMDIKQVDCVVSYEMPVSIKAYVHRVGRTARAGQSGVAYTLLSRNQFFHFKKDLRSVGKTKVKEQSFHASHTHDLESQYQEALNRLETAVKISTQAQSGQTASLLQAARRKAQSEQKSPTKKKRKKHSS